MSVTTRESEYSDRDRALLLADWDAENAPRGSHGILMSEATDPATQYDWMVPLPTTDFVAAKIRAVQDAYSKQYPDADMRALLWRAERQSAVAAEDERSGP